MKKILMRVFFLTVFIALSTGKYNVSAAESIYVYSKDDTIPYRGEETFVITSDDISDLIFHVESECIYPEVRKLVIEEGVTSFSYGYRAFPNVETIYFSSTVKSINGFSNTSTSYLSKLKEIKVSGKNKWYTTENGILFNKKKTVLYKYPSTLTYSTYTIPDTVTTIQDGAFYNSNLKTVTIGASFKVDQLYKLQNQLRNIKEFKVNSKNISYSAKKGVLFNKKGDTLLLYPNGKGKNYTVPKGTVMIGESAFQHSVVTKIVLPAGLTTIKEQAFRDSSLTAITIPLTVVSMAENAFRDATALKAIVVEAGNKQYAAYEGILYNASRTKLIFIPEGYSKTTLKLPSTLKSLSVNSTNAYLSIFRNFTEIVIPKALKEIDIHYKCFDKIIIEKGNTAFSLYNGSLYNKAGTELIFFKKQEKADFPDTLTNVDINKLIDSDIKELEISKNVKSIRRYAKDLCYIIPTLEKLTVAEDNPYYTCENGMLFNKDNTVLYDIPRNTTELIIPDTVTEFDIAPLSDYNYHNLTRVTIPEGLTKLDGLDYAYKMDNLKAFTVAKGNPVFTSIDGVLYNKDVTELIWYPMQKEDKTFTMPNTVKEADVVSLMANPYLESLVLSDSLVKETLYYSYTWGYYLPSKSIKEYVVSDNNPHYKTVDGVLYNKDMTVLIAYPYQKSSESFTIPDTVTNAVGICNNRTYINDEKYDNTSNPYLKELVIGKNVKELFEYSDLNCPIFNLPNLQKIEVKPINKYFSAKDGILYSKDFSKMYVYPKDSRNTELIIPKSTKELFDGYIDATMNPYLTALKVEDGSKAFYTDGTSLYNYQGNIMYCRIGGKYFRKIPSTD
ncbi:hypothetical protein acsn021_40400 [Anaerocolumna cellulosilytica]|uniref:Uncharacterized protein n=1 Tax=Anaerocolumna cellulosilytica TaxID=433286 RepID=A0A6S6RCK4_9FIRM|nr:leucine-rich repeat protein [Anaerocolumna cellulosilytica]MBB5197716.1 hypothetical protein [Anaerocolumna cellulosilytica]BCJ96471.1 hypothetical protein acsn021_40400 [Anaerocolumna cellulosilytica]